MTKYHGNSSLKGTRSLKMAAHRDSEETEEVGHG